MEKFFHAFFSPLDFRRAVPQVWDGFQTNIKLMVIAELLVLAFALLVAIIRGLPGGVAVPLRALAIVYTDFFRGTPLIRTILRTQGAVSRPRRVRWLLRVVVQGVCGRE